jgi:hypothetical protein
MKRNDDDDDDGEVEDERKGKPSSDEIFIWQECLPPRKAHDKQFLV